MSSLDPSRWTLVLVLLLQLQSVKVQQVNVAQRLLWLNGQFQQFQASTKTRLDRLALNQNRNYAQRVENVQALTVKYNQLSQNLIQLDQRTEQKILSLRRWSTKLEEKSNQIEARMVLLEGHLRETRRLTQEKKRAHGQDLSSLTLELQSHKGRLAAVQAQHDELLLELKGLKESLNIQPPSSTQVKGGGNVSRSDSL